jgi:hypothetical protein
MEAQCWICPKCHDDHRAEGPCSPKSTQEFAPRLDDGSYIAEQYRLRIQEHDQLKAEVERLKRVIAKELTENDDLGCEYTYVIALKEEVRGLSEKHDLQILVKQNERYHFSMERALARLEGLHIVATNPAQGVLECAKDDLREALKAPE